MGVDAYPPPVRLLKGCSSCTRLWSHAGEVSRRTRVIVMERVLGDDDTYRGVVVVLDPAVIAAAAEGQAARLLQIREHLDSVTLEVRGNYLKHAPSHPRRWLTTAVAFAQPSARKEPVVDEDALKARTTYD